MSLEQVRVLIAEAPELSAEWPEPISLPDGLPAVDAFSSEFLPASVSPWVDDIAERLQCPPDYVAVAAITALGSVIGRRIGVRPQDGGSQPLGPVHWTPWNAEIARDGRSSKAYPSFGG
jgi:hypothetical protein